MGQAAYLAGALALAAGGIGAGALAAGTIDRSEPQRFVAEMPSIVFPALPVDISGGNPGAAPGLGSPDAVLPSPGVAPRPMAEMVPGPGQMAVPPEGPGPTSPTPPHPPLSMPEIGQPEIPGQPGPEGMTEVPEPASLLVLLTGGLAAVFSRRARGPSPTRR